MANYLLGMVSGGAVSALLVLIPPLYQSGVGGWVFTVDYVVLLNAFLVMAFVQALGLLIMWLLIRVRMPRPIGGAAGAAVAMLLYTGCMVATTVGSNVQAWIDAMVYARTNLAYLLGIVAAGGTVAGFVSGRFARSGGVPSDRPET